MDTNQNILLVEDDLDVSNVLQEIIRSEGYNVDCVSNGQEALRYLHKEARCRPSLILLDIMMPQMNGYQFREEQNKDSELSQIPTVLMSADSQIEQRAKILRVDGFIRKPFDLYEVMHVIKRYCLPQR